MWYSQDIEDSVECLNRGVGASEDVITFTSGSDTTNHVATSSDSRSPVISVPVTKLDTVLHGKTPVLIKIDVEGYETQVILGAANTLKQPSLNVVIMELNGSGSRYGFDEGNIVKLMRECGFGTYSYDPFTRSLISLSDKNHNSGNTLFIKNEAAAIERIRTSPKISILGKRI